MNNFINKGIDNAPYVCEGVIPIISMDVIEESIDFFDEEYDTAIEYKVIDTAVRMMLKSIGSLSLKIKIKHC